MLTILRNIGLKPLYARCERCSDTRPAALAIRLGVCLCANCRHDQQGHKGPRGRCAVCWRDGLPVQRHHPGRALWHPGYWEPVCRSCHLVLSAMQKSVSRWDVRLPFHDLQDRLDVDHGWRELAQGTWETGMAWAEGRPLFEPAAIWRPARSGDDLMIVPLAPHSSGATVLTIVSLPLLPIKRG